jgi:hypothetical protein
MKIILPLLCTFLIVSCTRENGDNRPNCTDRLVKMDWPAYVNGARTLYYYNTDNTLAKVVYYNDSVTISQADTFYYSNGKLVKSAFALNNANFANPYTYTNWTHNGNSLATCSVYLRTGSSYTLYSTSSFETDSENRITAINQLQGANLQRNRFEYDANSNLRKVFIKFNSDPESLYDEYFDYDSIPNPFYQLPLSVSHDIYLHGIERFSKHNYRRHIRGSNNETFALTYENGKVKTIMEVSNPAAAITQRRFGFSCE